MSMNAEVSETQTAIPGRGTRALPPGAGLALAIVLGTGFWLGVIFLAL